MMDIELADRLDDAASRLPVSPAPVSTIILAAAQRRRRHARRKLEAFAAAGLLAVAGWMLAPHSSHAAPVGGAATGPTTTTPATRPAPLSLAQAKLALNAQRFRAYSGPRPPEVTEKQALTEARGSDAYSLGLVDVGMVTQRGKHISVAWHSAWVIGYAVYRPADSMSLGGRGKYAPTAIAGTGATASPPATLTFPTQQVNAVWFQVLDLVDVRTGRGFMSTVF